MASWRMTVVLLALMALDAASISCATVKTDASSLEDDHGTDISMMETGASRQLQQSSGACTGCSNCYSTGCSNCNWVSSGYCPYNGGTCSGCTNCYGNNCKNCQSYACEPFSNNSWRMGVGLAIGIALPVLAAIIIGVCCCMRAASSRRQASSTSGTDGDPYQHAAPAQQYQYHGQPAMGAPYGYPTHDPPHGPAQGIPLYTVDLTAPQQGVPAQGAPYQYPPAQGAYAYPPPAQAPYSYPGAEAGASSGAPTQQAPAPASGAYPTVK